MTKHIIILKISLVPNSDPSYFFLFAIYLDGSFIQLCCQFACLFILVIAESSISLSTIISYYKNKNIC